ncbi:MAG: sporulation transcriptional regulator SpoIIID [Clostridia bacterium]|nr:sporulation transcriptional regulator SpoIIID [Clostridia bacterium]
MDYTEERIYLAAHYMLEHSATVRDTARAVRSSKSTVHKDLTTRLMQLNPTLAGEVRKVLDANKAERHIRGGQATLNKYKRMKRE